MLDIDYIRKNIDKIRDLIKIGRADSSKVNVDEWLKLDDDRSSLIHKVELLRFERNKISSQLKSRPDQQTLEKLSNLKEEISQIEADLKRIESRWREILDWIPNVPYNEVPDGRSSEDNVEIKAWHPGVGYFSSEKLGRSEESGKFMPMCGTNADTEFSPVPHWDIGTKLGLFDLEAGAKVSGSRFYFLKGDGALLIYATFDLMLKKLISEGFTPLIVPVLVRERALYGSSHFPADADQVYKVESKNTEDPESDLFLVGSSEPSNFCYFADRILDLSKPIKITAQSPCFRTEVGSWGKDVRGIKRAHQFEKIEMNIIMEADDEKARQMHEYLLSLNEWLLQTLEIPYHVINMCVGDLGYYAACKKYDVEFWTPSQQCYTELMSNSITTDYQARRLNIKYRDENGRLRYAYTLNDTAVTHRILIAILEHYQQSDGSLKIPEALRDYLKKDVIYP
ncbi:serine--tRNA ligase [Candidatus Dojkabacteria bacterium]|uniref:Serine--tRNA ligase n=1 Tax=Candidatus Dojkabacteria bacterium TaxID=2099670 RepID=A0A3M0Z4W4_9BACT|nr:MAG: serine--tRNA ligase [Candidatus Dojkabacteria bacterium]